MAKNADGPASGRMGFGFREAQDAGVPFIAPPSAKQMDTDLKELAASRELRLLIEQDVNYGPKIAKMVRLGHSGQEILAELAPKS